MEGNKSTAVLTAEKKKRTPLLKNQGLQTLISSLVCIVLGLLVGYVALLIINPKGAAKAITVIVQNFMTDSTPEGQMKIFGATLIKTAPLIMCSLSVLFAYKVGLFNIGAAGQYVAGAGAALYFALGLNMPWYVCMIAALLAGALLGVVAGAMKAWLNVNEVISCIMLNWIMLYGVNTLLVSFTESGMPDTLPLATMNKSAIIPSLGLDKLLNHGKATIAIPMAVVIAVLIWVFLSKTKLGYELRATGSNVHAAKYSGMREKYNLTLTMAIAGGLAGLGAAMYFLSDFKQWGTSQSAVPAMGFNGIAAAFLGGLHPIGAVFSSYFIEHITNAGAYIDNNMYFSQISDLIAAVVIYLCGFVLLFRGFITKLSDRVEDAGGWRVVLFSKRNLPKTIAVVCALVIIAVLGVVVMKDAAVLTPMKNQVTEQEAKIAKQSTETNEKSRQKYENELATQEENKAAQDARIAEITAELELLLQQFEQTEAISPAFTQAVEQYVAGQDEAMLTEALSDVEAMLSGLASAAENEGEANR